MKGYTWLWWTIGIVGVLALVWVLWYQMKKAKERKEADKKAAAAAGVVTNPPLAGEPTPAPNAPTGNDIKPDSATAATYTV